MPARQSFANPFYFLLILVGLVFLLTACAYTVTAVRRLPDRRESLTDVAPETGDAGQLLLDWMDRYGFRALMVELVLLGAATTAAMATDRISQRRAERSREAPATEEDRSVR